jgi:hypothetical protein
VDRIKPIRNTDDCNMSESPPSRSELPPSEDKISRILELLIFEGPLNAYQIGKKLNLKHATVSLILGKLESSSRIRISSTSAFRTGLLKKNYDITASGFFSLLLEKKRLHPIRGTGDEYFDSTKIIPRLYPNDPVWDNIETLIQKNGDLWPWLSKRYKRMKNKNMNDLMRALILLGLNALIDFQSMLRRDGRYEQTGVPEHSPRFFRTLAGFFLRVLFPQVFDDGALGMSDSATFYEIFFPKMKREYDFKEVKQEVFDKVPRPVKRQISLLAEQVREFLRIEKDIAKNFQDHISWAAGNIKQLSEDLEFILEKKID